MSSELKTTRLKFWEIIGAIILYALIAIPFALLASCRAGDFCGQCDEQTVLK